MIEEASMPQSWKRWRRRVAWTGALLLVLWVAGAVFWRAPAFQGYWFAWVFWAGLALGFVALCCLQFLTRGAWSLAVQRFAEAGSLTLPLMVLLFVPVIFGMAHVFPWTAAHALDDAPHKRAYLTTPWFVVRSFACIGLLIPVAFANRRWSTREDHGMTTPEPLPRLRRLGAGGLLLYTLVMLVASTDWVMSLQPGWYSTMLVVIMGMSQLLAALAACIALLAVFSKRLVHPELLDTKCLRDLGNLLLALVIFWTYVTFSQYLIIWSANLPREISWYLSRSTTGWKTWATLLAIFQFAIPFAVLLSRKNKDNLKRLGAIAALVFVMGIAHVYWLVAPAFGLGAMQLCFALLAFAGMGAIWSVVFLSILARRPLLPLRPKEELIP
jgi:hypothetical protein